MNLTSYDVLFIIVLHGQANAPGPGIGLRSQAEGPGRSHPTGGPGSPHGWTHAGGRASGTAGRSSRACSPIICKPFEKLDSWMLSGTATPCCISLRHAPWPRPEGRPSTWVAVSFLLIDLNENFARDPGIWVGPGCLRPAAADRISFLSAHAVGGARLTTSFDGVKGMDRKMIARSSRPNYGRRRLARVAAYLPVLTAATALAQALRQSHRGRQSSRQRGQPRDHPRHAPPWKACRRSRRSATKPSPARRT